jgi:hypothetical protein
MLPDHRNEISRSIAALPGPIRSMMDQNRIHIFNVGPWSYTRPMGSLGTFFIPGCSEDDDCSGPLTYQGKPGLPSILPESIVDAVDGRTVTYKWDLTTEGAKLARDIIGVSAFRDSSDNLTQYGVFIAAGAEPTEEEIEAAHDKLNAHYDKLVRYADGAFEVNGGMEVGDNGKSYSGITRDHINACRALGLDRPWARKNAKMVPCEGCGQPVAVDAVRCHHGGCGAILDEERARKLFPHLYAHEAKAPRKEAPAPKAAKATGKPGTKAK